MFLRKPERPSDYLIYFYMMYGLSPWEPGDRFLSSKRLLSNINSTVSIAATCTFIEWISNAVRKENGRRESEMKEKDAELET